jgi:glycosyltransferase involved in cell wall biosynthesis
LAVERCTQIVDSDQPQVGVVIPAYNCAAELERALASLAAQTYRNFQFVVVDDGSDDDLAAIAVRHGSWGSCVRQSHAGAGRARNHALKLLKAEYLAFLDADDEWLPNKLERQLAFMQAHPEFALTCTDFAQCGTVRWSSYFATTAMPFSGRVFERLVRDCFISTPTVMVRRQVLDVVGRFEDSLRVSEDHNLWLRIAARFPIGVLNEVLSIRHLRPGSVSVSSTSEQKFLSSLASLEHVMESCSDQLSPAERRCVRYELCRRFGSYGGFLLSTNDREGGRKALYSALHHRAAFSPAARLAASYLPHTVYLGLRSVWRSFRRGAPG